MSLTQLRSMNFPALEAEVADATFAEGMSAAQCAYIKTLSFTSAVYSCGGTPKNYSDIYNRECR
ncbi:MULTISPECIES: hypothetical protein [unclassified Streptomyces]|uniref:hypothetical protein n=1 Tax=unclassified Streptomyces TaxID=2593676 RepID=UPI000DC77AF7|nr:MULTISPECIES: hypothetical protein [unclassified Streptomyces]AWZ07984.1 hypothetical protein DRB89_29070 [Streptomyces sp. ICC4]AWZ15727.1 hypothetical protein DRB96_29640 [Streptomyces sp. ICC1]